MKHLEFGQKYSAASRIFNSLLSVSSPPHKRGPYASSDKVGKTLKALLEKWARNEANAVRTFLDSVRKIQKYSGHYDKMLTDSILFTWWLIDWLIDLLSVA